MVLAAYGTHVREHVLESHARLELRGTPVEEPERLARRYHLTAEVRETTVEDLRRILMATKNTTRDEGGQTSLGRRSR
jgi:hypothetical protein